MNIQSSSQRFSKDELANLLALLESADTVELKLTVAEEGRRSAITSLEMDPLDARIRQIYFFDTPDLALDRHGLVARARRVQGGKDDAVVKLRPVVPGELPAKLRRSPDFGVEVDAMPGGFVCSGRLRARVAPERLKQVVAGERGLRSILTKQQRKFFAQHAPDGIEPNDLAVLGPITVLKLNFAPPRYGRRMTAELWTYPDGSRILELSTKCAPHEAFDVAARTRVFLEERGVDLSADQQTKTKSALTFFSSELSDG